MTLALLLTILLQYLFSPTNRFDYPGDFEFRHHILLLNCSLRSAEFYYYSDLYFFFTLQGI
jgi:hypothetical protein